MAKTAGEALFESYLTGRNISFDYEPAIGTKAPDYLLRMTPDVLCEVEDFGEGDEDRRIAQIPIGQARGGAVEPHVRIREKIEAAARQLREYKGRFPTVIVLHNPGFFVNLDSMFVAGAMYGNLQFVLEVGTAVLGPTQTRFDRKKAKLRPGQNTTISAVAVLERIKPNFHLIEEVLRTHAADPRTKTLSTVEAAVEGFQLIARFKAQHPEIDFDHSEPRVRVFYNAYALVPLVPTVFAGPHDQHLYPDPSDQ